MLTHLESPPSQPPLHSTSRIDNQLLSRLKSRILALLGMIYAKVEDASDVSFIDVCVERMHIPQPLQSLLLQVESDKLLYQPVTNCFVKFHLDFEKDKNMMIPLKNVQKR